MQMALNFLHGRVLRGPEEPEHCRCGDCVCRTAAYSLVGEVVVMFCRMARSVHGKCMSKKWVRLTDAGQGSTDHSHCPLMIVAAHSQTHTHYCTVLLVQYSTAVPQPCRLPLSPMRPACWRIALDPDCWGIAEEPLSPTAGQCSSAVFACCV